MYEGQELSIFFINIPRSRFLISKIFKVLEAHEVTFIEIPKPSNLHNEVMNLTEKINEYRIIIRRSFYNLDSKIRPYYAPQEVRLVDEVQFQSDFEGIGSSNLQGGIVICQLTLRTQGNLHFAHRRGAFVMSEIPTPQPGNEQATPQQNQEVRELRL